MTDPANDPADRLLRSLRGTNLPDDLPESGAVFSRARQRARRQKVGAAAATLLVAGGVITGIGTFGRDAETPLAQTVPAASSPNASSTTQVSDSTATPTPTEPVSSPSSKPSVDPTPSNSPSSPVINSPKPPVVVPPAKTYPLANGYYCGDIKTATKTGSTYTIAYRPWVGNQTAKLSGKVVELPVSATAETDFGTAGSSTNGFLAQADGYVSVSAVVDSGVITALDYGTVSAGGNFHDCGLFPGDNSKNAVYCGTLGSSTGLLSPDDYGTWDAKIEFTPWVKNGSDLLPGTKEIFDGIQGSKLHYSEAFSVQDYLEYVNQTGPVDGVTVQVVNGEIGDIDVVSFGTGAPSHGCATLA